MPVPSTKVKQADDYCRANFAYLEEVLSAEHNFGVSGTGKEYPGKGHIVKSDTYSNIDSLSDILGGLAFATDYHEFVTNSGAAWIRRGAFPAGTKCLFYQANAPTGWTIDTTAAYDDKVVILTKGSANGGTAGGSAVSGSTWTISGLSHNHRHGMTEVPKHRHTLSINSTGSGPAGTDLRGASTPSNTENSSSEGGGSTVYTDYKSPTIACAGTWRPAGKKFIVCTKD